MRSRTSICSSVAIRLSGELEGKTETNVVIAVRRRVIVAISSAAIPGGVVPAATAVHTVNAL